jgi:hypothetical protein
VIEGRGRWGVGEANLVEEASDEAVVHHLVLVQVVEESLQVHREVLEDEVESVLLHDHVFQAHYARVAQLLNPHRLKPLPGTLQRVSCGYLQH